MFGKILSSILTVALVLPLVAVAGDNKEADAMLSYPFDTQETIKIGIALGEAASLYLLSEGKSTAVVNDARIKNLVEAAKSYDTAKAMLSEAEHATQLKAVTSEIDLVKGQMDLLNAQTDAAKIAEHSAGITKLTARKAALEALKPVADAVKAEALTSAKKALATATREVTSNSDKLKAAVNSGGRTVKTLKFLGRTFCLVDLGIKGYYWMVLDGDAGYSPAAEMVYRGSRRIYQRAKEQAAPVETRGHR